MPSGKRECKSTKYEDPVFGCSYTGSPKEKAMLYEELSKLYSPRG